MNIIHKKRLKKKLKFRIILEEKKWSQAKKRKNIREDRTKMNVSAAQSDNRQRESPERGPWRLRHHRQVIMKAKETRFEKNQKKREKTKVHSFSGSRILRSKLIYCYLQSRKHRSLIKLQGFSRDIRKTRTFY
jgi:hypothetical protein